MHSSGSRTFILCASALLSFQASTLHATIADEYACRSSIGAGTAHPRYEHRGSERGELHL
jgi:hypothetical protein